MPKRTAGLRPRTSLIASSRTTWKFCSGPSFTSLLFSASPVRVNIESETSIMITTLLLVSRIPKKLIAAPLPVPPRFPDVPNELLANAAAPEEAAIVGGLADFLSIGISASAVAPLASVRSKECVSAPAGQIASAIFSRAALCAATLVRSGSAISAGLESEFAIRAITRNDVKRGASDEEQMQRDTDNEDG